MLTKFGMEVRKKRIDKSMKLAEMADGLQVTSAYLSAVENGKKKLTTEFAEKVITFLGLESGEKISMLEAAYASQEEFSIKMKDDDSALLRNAAGAFARKIESSNLSEQQAKSILEILEGK
ncbi:helix-turn-helix transcriptional regulator [Pseudoalteromonas sp. BZB3]|uniref:helix-turn-helix domain-containing protein n=1 Tax=Pseudoalteromonas sp. BZB3 TaxID=3136670 RepID=UPI0032C3D9F6